MKKKIFILFVSIFISVGMTTGASGATIALFDWGLRVNAEKFSSGFFPGANVPGDLAGATEAVYDITGFDFGTGLGTIKVTVNSAGNYSVINYLDLDIDETDPGDPSDDTYYNYYDEWGSAHGTPDAQQRWEIDEPGFGTPALGTEGVAYTGDIFDNFDNPFSLDKEVNYDSNDAQFLEYPDDVAMAISWDFSLGANEIAEILFVVQEVAPTGGIFYLEQNDPADKFTGSDSVYYYSTLDIKPVPEPSTVIMLGLGLLGLGLVAIRKRPIKNITS